jgi:hypothetical protein
MNQNDRFWPISAGGDRQKTARSSRLKVSTKIRATQLLLVDALS